MLDTAKRISVYQPEQLGLKFPELPSFATPAEERRHRKERLVAACRAFVYSVSAPARLPARSAALPSSR